MTPRIRRFFARLFDARERAIRAELVEINLRLIEIDIQINALRRQHLPGVARLRLEKVDLRHHQLKLENML